MVHFDSDGLMALFILILVWCMSLLGDSFANNCQIALVAFPPNICTIVCNDLFPKGRANTNDMFRGFALGWQIGVFDSEANAFDFNYQSSFFFVCKYYFEFRFSN